MLSRRAEGVVLPVIERRISLQIAQKRISQ